MKTTNRVTRRVALLLARIIVAAAILAPPAAPARAEIYRYLGPDGAWRFSNKKSDTRYKRWRVGHEKFELEDEFTEVLGNGPYDDIFVEAGKLTGLQPALLKAVAAQESGFNARAISPKGALGLMQLMPETAKILEVKDPFDPQEAIHGGARWLRLLVDTFSGNLRLAVAAYNCGEGPVRRVMDVPRIDETQTYVRRVFRFFAAFRGRAMETTNEEHVEK